MTDDLQVGDLTCSAQRVRITALPLTRFAQKIRMPVRAGREAEGTGYNPFPPGAPRLAGSSFPELKHSEGGRNREQCWQNCEENRDIGEKIGGMDAQGRI